MNQETTNSILTLQKTILSLNDLIQYHLGLTQMFRNTYQNTITGAVKNNAEIMHTYHLDKVHALQIAVTLINQNIKFIRRTCDNNIALQHKQSH